MELTDDLGRSTSTTASDLFYDFDPKAEQVTFIDSVINDINAGIIDPNNNNCSMNDSGGGGSNSLKSFIFDEMLTSPLSGTHSHQHHIINSQDLISREVESYISEEINNATMHSLGFSWTDGIGQSLSTVSSSPEEPDSVYWLANPSGQVTTLTSLLEDPTFGPYDSPGGETHEIKLQYFLQSDQNNTNKLPPIPNSCSSPLVSSDLITSTFANDGHSPNSQQQTQQQNRETVIIAPNSEPSNTIVSWSKQSPDSHHPQYVYCHETSTLLRTALQGGGGKPQHVPVHQVISTNGKHISSDGNNELRRFLSYPPIGQVHSSQTSPTSTSNLSPLGGHNPNHLPPMNPNQIQYCEYKILEPIMFSPHPADDVDIPTNVEELIMTRIDGSNYSTSSPRKKSPDTSDRKISSSLSTKWTYTNVTGPGTKTGVKRRSKKQKLSENGSSNSDHQCIKISNISPVGSLGGEGSNSPNSSSGAAGIAAAISRKERSLHHCNICNKGFKDKYSVTVHIRTHTGEKPFACTLCGKSFRQKAHLAKHYQTHAAKANGQTHGKSGAKRNPTNHSNNTVNTTTSITTPIPAIS